MSAEEDFLDPTNWMSPRDLAAILGIKPQSIYNLISEGGDLPPSYKRGRFTRFYRPEVLTWWQSARRVPAVTQIKQLESRPQ